MIDAHSTPCDSCSLQSRRQEITPTYMAWVYSHVCCGARVSRRCRDLNIRIFRELIVVRDGAICREIVQVFAPPQLADKTYHVLDETSLLHSLLRQRDDAAR